MYKKLYDEARDTVFRLSMLILTNEEEAKVEAARYASVIYNEMSAKLKEAESIIDEIENSNENEESHFDEEYGLDYYCPKDLLSYGIDIDEIYEEK